MVNREAIAELADAVYIGDDLAFFEIIKDHPQIIRWVNPAACNGAEQIAALHDDLPVQATPLGNRVMIVLADSSAISCETLHALIVGADEVTFVASRTTLRSILRSSTHGLAALS